ncbi:hypothetical protein PVAP13_1NG304300 [Panicum virgatum]|uniref:Nucleoside diphosphate kinase-like domain-containing protein n=1 Tax=Panicum virgatum TaxID=38727 RepID=A0A8T0WY90_PANVG|nr:hypothetical protein PVAP13_1NG304300 [Panicum virgatum]
MAGATSPAARALVSRLMAPLILLFLYGCCSCGAVERERTLAMIKPDGLSGNYTEKIKAAILDSGFHIVKETQVQLDAERASLFYAEHSGRSFFDSLVKYITSGPVLAMVLERPDAIAQWRALIGPTDARKAKTTHPNRLNIALFLLFFFPVKILHMTSIILLVIDGKGKQLLAIVIRDAFCTNPYSIF